MLVVDTSAIVAALLSRAPQLRERLAQDGDLHAPHLIDVELVHVLRRLLQRGAISRDRAHDIRADFAALPIIRYSHEPLSDRAWALRDTLTPYDAVFVALAEALGAPLVTCDARLAQAPVHEADIELYDPSTQ